MVKLSKGSLLLLHLAASGHVWRGEGGLWFASTLHTKRNVDRRINKMIDQGVLRATSRQNFPEVTPMGRMLIADSPLPRPLVTW